MASAPKYDRPHSSSLRRWLGAANLAGQGPKLTAPVDRYDHAYLFHSNGQAAEIAVGAVVERLLAEAGPEGAHGSIPALRYAAKHIEQPCHEAGLSGRPAPVGPSERLSREQEGKQVD